MNNQDINIPSSSDDVLEIIKPYINKWYWFIISAILFLIIAFLYIKVTTPVYNVKSAVLIKDSKKSMSSVGDMGMLDGLSGFGGMSTSSIENELEIFQSKKLIRDVSQIHHLQTTIFSDLTFSKKELFGDTSPVQIIVVNEKKNKKFPKEPFKISYNNNNYTLKSKEYNIDQNYSYNQSVSLPFANIIVTKNKDFDAEKAEELTEELDVIFSTLEATVSAIQKTVKVDLADKDATVIELSIDSEQVDKASTIIKGIITAYNKDAIVDKNSESQKTKDFIDGRISVISNELGAVESEKERFKSANKITDILTETKINLESSAASKQKELELDAQLQLTNDLISYVNKQGNYQLLPTNVGLNNVESSNSISMYNKMILERNRLLENATTANPLVIELTDQIASLKKSVSESLLKNRAALQFAINEYTGAQQTIDSRITKLPHQEKLFRSLERQQHIKESLYLLLLEKREETAISLAVVAPKARIVDPVYISDKPVAPKKMLILLSGLILGLLLPFAYIYISTLLKTKITSKTDLKKLSKLPLIGEIPALKKSEEQIVRSNDFSQLAEALRIMVTNMGFLLEESNNGKVILVTSSIKGEGKTFVSMNLALTLASTNKVIIIGADIRNPQLQRYNQRNKKFGLTEFLHDSNVNLNDIIQPNPINPKSDIIYSGIIPPNPIELLKNGRLNILLEELKTSYDYIIVDTAPLMLVTDTLLITKLADLKIYVTRANYTENAFIDYINEATDTGKIDNVALVINDVKKENFSYGNKYGYGYNNK